MSTNTYALKLRQDTTAALREARRERAALDVRIGEYEQTLKMLGGPAEPGGAVGSDQLALMQPPGEAGDLAAPTRVPQTIAEMIVTILERHRSDGLSAPGIMRGLQVLRPGTKPNSVYPTLGRLLDDGVVRRTGSGRAGIYFPKETK